MLAPQHALRHPRGAAGVQHVQVVGGGLDGRRLRCAGRQGLLVVDGAVEEFVARVVGDLDEHLQLRQVGQDLGDARREGGVVDQRGGAGIGQQVLQFVLDVAVVDVERSDAGAERPEQRLDELVAVVGVDAQQVLADLVARQVRSRGVAAESARMQVRGEPVGPVDDVGVRVAPVALCEQHAIGDRRRDGVEHGGNGELHCGPWSRREVRVGGGAA